MCISMYVYTLCINNCTHLSINIRTVKMYAESAHMAWHAYVALLQYMTVRMQACMLVHSFEYTHARPHVTNGHVFTNS